MSQTIEPFYPIVDDVRWLERFVPLGVRFVQLRLKDKPRAELIAQISAAKDLCQEHGCQLVVNDYWEIALELGCDYIHLGQEDLDTADLGAIKAAKLKLGVSTHDGAELQRGLDVQPTYIALGPVYYTQLKAMKWSPQGLERVTDWVERVSPLPLVAIGGITLERAPDVFAAGAPCVSVVTDILWNAQPEQRLKDWLALTEQYRKS